MSLLIAALFNWPPRESDWVAWGAIAAGILTVGAAASWAWSSGNWVARRLTGHRRALHAARAALRPPYGPLPDEHGPNAPLESVYGIVPFFRRESELAELTAWCASKSRVAVALRVGQGGAGKTRLAAELCRFMSEHEGWLAGFLRDQTTDEHLTALAAAPRPLLVAIDYAETRPETIVRLLVTFVACRKRPVRVLLLAREPGDWWRELPNRFPHDAPAARAAVEAVSPEGLQPLTPELEDREGAFEEAVRAFSGILNRDPRSAMTAPKLDDPAFEIPLFVHMAALTAIDSGSVPTDAEPTLGADLLGAALRREARYWAETAVAAGLPAAFTTRARREAVAVVCLAPTLNEKQLCEALKALPELTDANDAHLTRQVALWLRSIYPGRDDEWLRSLQPDRLAESLVAAVVQELPDLVRELVDHLPPTSIPEALTVLTRAARGAPAAATALALLFEGQVERFADVVVTVAQQTGDPIGSLLAEELLRNPNPSVVNALAAAIPQETLALREAALAVEEQLVQEARSNHEGEADARLAKALNNLAVRRGDLGRREEALSAIEEAVELNRTLATAHPESFSGDLAGSLSNLSNRLRELGRHEEALAAIEEAVALNRALTAAQPETFTGDLAAGLNNLCLVLGQLGRRDEALAAIEEAVVLYRAPADAERFTPRLAMSLSNLSVRLGQLGRLEEALAAIEEAVTLDRALAAHQPDAFNPQLALSLMSYSNRLAGLGRWDEALAPIEEARTLFRALAAARPDAFTPDHATSLNNLSLVLSELGRSEEALAAIEEAVQLRRQLTAAYPDAFTPDLASALNNLSTRLSDVGELQEALAVIYEVVTLNRSLAASNPDAFTPELAGSLNNLSNRLSDDGREEEGLAAVEEALAVHRMLAAKHPDVFASDLAMSLYNLSNRLRQLDRSEEALRAIEEAVRLRRQLAGIHFDAFSSDLAMSLNVLSLVLDDLGRRAEARAAMEEAVTLIRPPIAARPN